MRVALTAVVLLASSSAFGAEPSPLPGTHAGTLTCTMKAGPSTSANEAELSCSFQSISGTSATFSGFIARDPQAPIPAGKRVLVWSVLAQKMDIDFKSLAGRYVGQSGGDQASKLVNESSTVVLDPVTSSSQLGNEPSVTVLALRLEPVRA